MALVPQGPGQLEQNGPLKNPQAPNEPGVYQDPQSKNWLHVMHPAGADALVRMGWRKVADEVEEWEAKLAKDAKKVKQAVENKV